MRKISLFNLFFFGFITYGFAAEITIGELRFRATHGTMPNSAAYVSITNNSIHPDRLVKVTSGLSKKTELHTMKMENDVVKMRKITDGIVIGAMKTINLAPGGDHIMLIGLTAPLNLGEQYQIKLHFERAGKIIVYGKAKLPKDVGKSSKNAEDGHSHGTSEKRD